MKGDSWTSSLTDTWDGMNLKRYLLVRMITLGLLCWVLISSYVVWRTANEVGLALISDANQLQEKVEYAFYKRRVNPEKEGTPSLLGNQYGLLLGPYCLNYEGYNGEQLDSDCDALAKRKMHSVVLNVLNLPPEPLTREIRLWGQPFGELLIEPDPKLVTNQFWSTLQDLLLLTTVLIASLAALCYFALTRAFQATRLLVGQLDSLALSEDAPIPQNLTALEPKEFNQIASGINRLSQRLREMTQARQKLSLKLLDVQEEERRELAHLVHADLGQSLSLIAVHCAQLRAQITPENQQAREQLESMDLTLEDAFDRLRAVLVNKCPPVMQGQNLGMAIQDLCTQWEINAGQSWKVSVHQDQEALGLLKSDHALSIYRTIEESLANVRKHGNSSEPVQVTLRKLEDRIELSITNASQPNCDDQEDLPSGGMGLQLLAERIRVHGGVWQINRTESQFKVTAYFPLGALNE